MTIITLKFTKSHLYDFLFDDNEEYFPIKTKSVNKRSFNNVLSININTQLIAYNFI